MSCDLSAHLVVESDRRKFRALGVDISRHGLGIVAFEALPCNSKILLVLKARGITLQVVWCKPDTVREGIHHIGLQSHDPAINIETLLVSEGLLPPPPDKEFPVTFEALRDAVAVVNITDPRLLRSGHLSLLAEMYHAYPIRFAGASLAVLIPRGIKPSEAAKLSEDEAQQRGILIARVERGIPSLIWPKAADSTPRIDGLED